MVFNEIRIIRLQKSKLNLISMRRITLNDTVAVAILKTWTGLSSSTSVLQVCSVTWKQFIPLVNKIPSIHEMGRKFSKKTCYILGQEFLRALVIIPVISTPHHYVSNQRANSFETQDAQVQKSLKYKARIKYNQLFNTDNL